MLWAIEQLTTEKEVGMWDRKKIDEFIANVAVGVMLAIGVFIFGYSVYIFVTP